MIISLLITACTANQPIDDSESDDISETVTTVSGAQSEVEPPLEKTGIIAEQILNGNDGEIHYSDYFAGELRRKQNLSLDDDYAELKHDVVLAKILRAAM